MSAFDDLLAELRDAGVQDNYIDRLKAASDGSPLRKERDEWKTKAETAMQEAQRYRTATIGGFLTQLGFAGNPDALNIPAELEPNRDAVTGWAVEMGLVAKPEPSPEEQARAAEEAGHERVVAATAGAQAPLPKQDEARAKVLAAGTEAEFWKAAQEAGMVRDMHT